MGTRSASSTRIRWSSRRTYIAKSPRHASSSRPRGSRDRRPDVRRPRGNQGEAGHGRREEDEGARARSAGESAGEPTLRRHPARVRICVSTSGMSLSSVTGTTGTNTTTTTSEPKDKAALDKDAFLKLLVAQLSHQDPLQPTEGTEFVAQLSQFAMVEQSIAQSAKLDVLSAQMTGLASNEAAGLVGKDVTVRGNGIAFDGLTATGASVNLDAAASKVTVRIQDASGKTVRTLEMGARGAGAMPITWDGKDDAGQPVAKGSYSIKIRGEHGRRQIREHVPGRQRQGHQGVVRKGLPGAHTRLRSHGSNLGAGERRRNRTMSITKAMYAGVSGLTAESNTLSIVGENIANTNTVGFKRSRATFENVLGGAIGAPDNVGGGVRLGRRSRSSRKARSSTRVKRRTLRSPATASSSSTARSTASAATSTRARASSRSAMTAFWSTRRAWSCRATARTRAAGSPARPGPHPALDRAASAQAHGEGPGHGEPRRRRDAAGGPVGPAEPRRVSRTSPPR